MRLLEERIQKDGNVKSKDVLKVDAFLNHQMDIKLFTEMAHEWKRLFADKPINKILTSSGKITKRRIPGCKTSFQPCAK